MNFVDIVPFYKERGLTPRPLTSENVDDPVARINLLTTMFL